MTMKKILFLAAGLLALSGCAMIGAAAIAMNASCKVKIDKHCVKGSCELINGVFFEKLKVLKKDSTGLPSDYVVTQRFECYNAGSSNEPGKIWFYKPNEHYKWRIDTVNVHYLQQRRMRVMAADQSRPAHYDEHFILNSSNYDTCPAHFENDTWYCLKISDQRLSRVFVYVNKRGHFKVHQENSGVSPI